MSNNSEIKTKFVEKKVKLKRQNFKRNNVRENQNFKHDISYNENGSNESFNVPSSNGESLDTKQLSLNLRSKGFNFGHLNIQGICGKNMCKFSEIKAILTSPENSSLHIFGISETKLKSHKLSSCFNIDGFLQEPFRKDNDSNGGGGIIVYVRNGINAKRRLDLETNNISCIWLEITLGKSKPFLIGNMYRPPDSKVEFIDRFENFIDNVSNEGKEMILMGDFNKNLLNEHRDIEWDNFVNSLGFDQLVCDPTRVTDTSSTLIDHIYTNSEENIANVHVCKISISDHYAIFGNRKQTNCIKSNTQQTITFRSFKNFDESRFISDMHDKPWETIEYFNDINEIVEVWNKMFLEIVNKHAPLKSHRIKRKYQPDWLIPQILDCIKERDKCKLNGKMDEYRLFRNKVSTMIDTAKKEAYQLKVEEGKDDPRSIWKLFKQFGMSKKGTTKVNNFEIKINNDIISDDQDIANIFNDYFVNIPSKLKEPIQPSEFKLLHNFVDSKVNDNTNFTIPFVNSSFVCNYLSNMDVTKATGLDCIGPRLLKIAPNVLTPSITYIINKSIESGVFPCTWKNAKVNPIFKTGDKDNVNNYRPISILPTLSKIIEKWTATKLMSYLDKYKLLHKNQSGFRKNHSTESALILMTDTWLKAINEGKLVGCAMIDFRKAFDLVDHNLLLNKLRIYRFNYLSLSWFKSYLSNRTQHVVINNLSSSSGDVVCGVPQGSILGPLLFLLFINDLPLSLKNSPISVDLYADDTTLYSTALDKSSLEADLQKALDSVHTWCLENGMLINTEKTKLMLIASRQKRSSLIDSDLKITFNNVDLKNSSNEKILGVHMDQNFVWNNQFQHVSKKISSHLWLLSQIRTYFNVQHRLLFYNAYIKSHIEYCCVVWGNSCNFNAYKIEKLQRSACKLILGNDYTTLDAAHKQLRMLSFDETIFINKAKVMYKIASNTAPIYLTDLFQMRGNESNLNNSQVNLRSTSNKNFLIP